MALAVEGVDPVENEQRLGLGCGWSGLAGKRVAARADIDLLHLGRGTGLFDGAVDQDLAVVHHGDRVGKLEHAVDIVLNQQDRNVRRDLLDQTADALAFGGGQPRERLIEQENTRLGCKRQCHIEQPLAAIGQRSGLNPLDAGETHGADHGGGLAVDLTEALGRRPKIEALGITRLHGESHVLGTVKAGKRLVI